MSHLGEDAEAFFQQGDDGTYEGGPKSLSPSTRDAAHEEDDLATEVTPELLERRDRLQRMVKGVVGMLGACVLALLPFRLGIAGGSSTASAATAIEASTPGVPMNAVPPHASTTSIAAEKNTLPPAPTPSPAIAGEAARQAVVTTKHRVQKPAFARAPSRPRHPAVHAASSLQHGVARTAAPSANAPFRAASTRRASAAHVPPTASFPD